MHIKYIGGEITDRNINNMLICNIFSVTCTYTYLKDNSNVNNLRKQNKQSKYSYALQIFTIKCCNNIFINASRLSVLNIKIKYVQYSKLRRNSTTS